MCACAKTQLETTHAREGHRIILLIYKSQIFPYFTLKQKLGVHLVTWSVCVFDQICTTLLTTERTFCGVRIMLNGASYNQENMVIQLKRVFFGLCFDVVAYTAVWGSRLRLPISLLSFMAPAESLMTPKCFGFFYFQCRVDVLIRIHVIIIAVIVTVVFQRLES